MEFFCNLDINSITAIATVVIAAIALIVSWRADRRNERESRFSDERREKHARLSVRPLLSSLMSGVPVKEEDEMMRFNFEVVNCGVGPAIIKNFVLQVDGEPKVVNNAQDYEVFLRELMKDFEDIETCYIGPNSVIKEGDKRILWSFKYNIKQDISFFQRLDVLIEFNSIYGDRVSTYDASKNRGA